MNVLLLDTYDGWTHSSPALRSISAFARKDAGARWRIDVNSLLRRDLARETVHGGRLIDEIVEASPDVIGLSCYVWNLQNFLLLSRVLGRRLPSATIVVGGPEVSSPRAASRVLSEAAEISFVVMGEGELPFALLLAELWRGGDPSEIPSLAHRTGGDVRTNDAGACVPNLDDIPSHILSGDLPQDCECVLFETYRGCPNRCRYCAWSLGPHRRFGLQRVLDELRTLVASDVKNVYIIDPVLGPDRGRAVSILDSIAHLAREHGAIPGFFAFPDPEWLDDEMAQRLREAGCSVSLGLQSTNPKTLALAGRRTKGLRAVEVATRQIPHFDVDLVWGLPGDGLRDLIDGFECLVSLGAPEVHCHRLSVLPGSYFDEHAEEFGLSFEETPPHRVLTTREMSADDIPALRRYAWGVHRFHNLATLTFRLISLLSGLSPAELVWDFVTWTGASPLDDECEPMSAFPEEALDLVRGYVGERGAALCAAQASLLDAALDFDAAADLCYKRYPLKSRRVRMTEDPEILDQRARPARPPACTVSLPGRAWAALDRWAGRNSDLPADGEDSYLLVHRWGYDRLDQPAMKTLEGLLSGGKSIGEALELCAPHERAGVRLRIRDLVASGVLELWTEG